MAIPTVNIAVHVEDASGNPVIGAKVNAKLNRSEVDAGIGYVIPDFTTVTTDSNGDATLVIWPNELGSTESSYEITIAEVGSRDVTSFTATIPNTDSNLWDVANLPAYPGKADGEMAAIDSANSAMYSEEWANKAEDSLVSTAAGGDQVDDYSALHWANKASADATQIAADLVATNQDTIDTAADLVLTNADVTYSEEWANKAEDSLVSTAAGGDQVDDYSALHWANKASASASAATEVNLFGATLVRLIHPDESRGLEELQTQGVFPVSFNQQWGGMGWGGLPDGTLGEVATCNISSDNTATTINATNVDSAFKVSKTTTVKAVFIRLYKTTNLTGNTTVTINGQSGTIPEKTITNSTEGGWIRVNFSTPPSVTAGTSYNINVATTGNAIEWMNGNGNYPHGGNNQFIIIAADAQNILQSGLANFNGALHGYEGSPLNQSGGFYFNNFDLNYKRGTIHLAGTGWDKDKTFYDSGLNVDANRIVLRCNPTTGVAFARLYKSDGVIFSIQGTTDISTGNHIVSLCYRAEGDGLDYVKLYVDSISEGVELTNKTIVLDKAFEGGHTTIGGGFPLAPTWTGSEDMTVLPSASGWTWTGTGTETSCMTVVGGILYQNGAGYTSTNTGYYAKTTTLNNAVGWAINTKLKVSSVEGIPSDLGLDIRIRDGAKDLSVFINTYYIEMFSGSSLGFSQVDLTKETEITVVGKGSDFYVYANNKLIFDGVGLLTSATATNEIRFGDGSATSGYNASAEWHKFKYFEGIYLPEYSTMQMSEFAHWDADRSSLLSTIYNSGTIKSVKDLAGLSENYTKHNKRTLQVKGISDSPTITGTNVFPLLDMSLFCFGSRLIASSISTIANSTTGVVNYLGTVINGIELNPNTFSVAHTSVANYRLPLVHSATRSVIGLSYVQSMWRVSAGVGTSTARARTLTVRVE